MSKDMRLSYVILSGEIRKNISLKIRKSSSLWLILAKIRLFGCLHRNSMGCILFRIMGSIAHGSNIIRNFKMSQ